MKTKKATNQKTIILLQSDEAEERQEAVNIQTLSVLLHVQVIAVKSKHMLANKCQVECLQHGCGSSAGAVRCAPINDHAPKFLFSRKLGFYVLQL